MYKYHCLNPISPVGMGQLDANYENTENAADADVILVRSAKMHGSLCRGRDRCI